MLGQILIIVGSILGVIIVGGLILVARAHRKVPQGKALVRTGVGGSKVAYDSGLFVIPIFHKVEEMDISLKTVEVHRTGKEGLVCKDNLRADIKVVFFVRVNKSPETIIEVAQTIGCARASENSTLNDLFDAKFSEALKTVGKQFDFVELYTARDRFKSGILETIGTDLNGYELDDCAIDYLEQTPIQDLDDNNILDSEGIKKIEELTSIQKQKTNSIRREREKVIKQQDVEATEAILQLELQQTEKEERQKRAIAVLRSEQGAEAGLVQTQQNLRYELEKKAAEEKIGIAEQNKQRQILVAQKNKERTEAVESERVETDRLLEVEKKERAVGEAKIDKEKVLEAKKRDIQSIIKERKAEEKKTVEEDQRILDVQEIAQAEREKNVAIIHTKQEAESLAIKQMRQAEADKLAAEVKAQQVVIEADAKKAASQKEAEARKIAAEALAAEEATVGLAEADVMKAKAEADEIAGAVEAKILEQKALAEANALKAKAEAERVQGMAKVEVSTAQIEVKEKDGLVEAKVLEQKALAQAKGKAQIDLAEAKGIQAKAEAMKLLDGVGKEHEEFKLRLQQQQAIRLAEIDAQRQITEAQAKVMAEAMRNANIDIVGGESKFFDSILNAINRGKSVDRMIDSSHNLQELKGALLGKGDLMGRIRSFVDHYGISSETLKNITMSTLMAQLYSKANDTDKGVLSGLIENVTRLGLASDSASSLL
ncbi:MAG: flotillin family protein [Saprospiraceae bacterium]|nr:flotillin family protein [Saprospiraceae bacterium]